MSADPGFLHWHVFGWAYCEGGKPAAERQPFMRVTKDRQKVTFPVCRKGIAAFERKPTITNL